MRICLYIIVKLLEQWTRSNARDNYIVSVLVFRDFFLYPVGRLERDIMRENLSPSVFCRWDR
jgi:hypothetical protein